MEFQWGKNPDYTIYLNIHLTQWALPLQISWQSWESMDGDVSCSIDINFLCFSFAIEVWKNLREVENNNNKRSNKL